MIKFTAERLCEKLRCTAGGWKAIPSTAEDKGAVSFPLIATACPLQRTRIGVRSEHGKCTVCHVERLILDCQSIIRRGYHLLLSPVMDSINEEKFSHVLSMVILGMADMKLCNETARYVFYSTITILHA